MADAEFWHKTADDRALEITRLRSRIAELEEALKPYVEDWAAALQAKPWISEWPASERLSVNTTVKHLNESLAVMYPELLNNTQNAPTASHSGEEASDVTKQA
jgi:hypothetical protein